MKQSIMIITVLTGLLFGLVFCCAAATEQSCSETITSSTPAENFIVNDDATVVSRRTGLMWMRCSLGQTWDGKSCIETADIFSWASALKIASGYAFAGHNDWRLPNKNELESIVEVSCSTPAINKDIFPATPAAYFWTSSPYAGVSGGAWSIDFAYGAVNASVKTGSNHVRLVRDLE